jgi:hypothetical protein
MNHTWANCRHFDPRTESANHLNLKNNSKRPRQEEEVAEETSDSSEESEHATPSAEHDD